MRRIPYSEKQKRIINQIDELKERVDRELSLRYDDCDEKGHYAPSNAVHLGCDGETCGHCFRHMDYTHGIIFKTMSEFGSTCTPEYLENLIKTDSPLVPHVQWIIEKRKNPLEFTKFHDYSMGLRILMGGRVNSI